VTDAHHQSMSGPSEAAAPRPERESAVRVALITLLNADPVGGEACYRQLERDLLRYLEWRCREPEDAAQEVFLRGLRRFQEGVEIDEKNFRAYFFGIAKMLVREGWKPKHRREQQLEPDAWNERISAARETERTEARIEVEQYLSHLSAADADLLVRYCQGERTTLEFEYRLTPENLRVRVFRLRAQLRSLRERGGDAFVAGVATTGNESPGRVMIERTAQRGAGD
jgi:DNA-directed RNA polymerase specialized sigma24 family protein